MNMQTAMAEAGALLEFKPEDAVCLGGYHNNVYEVIADQPLVVKFLETETNGGESLIAEMNWLSFLSRNGMDVVTPVEIGGKYITPLSNGLCMVVFEKAAGRHIDFQDPRMWNDSLFLEWGRSMGKLHLLALKYEPGPYKRKHWHEHDLFQRDMSILDESLQQRLKGCLQTMHDMNNVPDEFGLIHGDLHQHNLLFGPERLTILDFGDSEYHWFAYDAAVAVYHAVQTVEPGKTRMEFAKRFTDRFLEGYAQGKGNASGMHMLDFFLNFRHLYSYAYHRIFSEQDQLTPKQREYLEKMRLSLLADPSFLGYGLLQSQS